MTITFPPFCSAETDVKSIRSKAFVSMFGNGTDCEVLEDELIGENESESKSGERMIREMVNIEQSKDMFSNEPENTEKGHSRRSFQWLECGGH